MAACLNLRRQSTGQENERQRDEEEDRQHAKGVGDCGGAILVVVGAVRVGACLEPGAKHRFVTPKVKPFYYFIVIHQMQKNHSKLLVKRCFQKIRK